MLESSSWGHSVLQTPALVYLGMTIIILKDHQIIINFKCIASCASDVNPCPAK